MGSGMFLVTGTGHSGTGWAAELFTRLGFNCGHERWHNLEPYRGQHGPDSSWMAMSRLSELDMPILHLVRDPIKVVQSFMRSGTYRDPDNACEFTRRTYRELDDLNHAETELDRCIIRITRWDGIAPQYATQTLRIEDANPRQPQIAAQAIRAITGTTPSAGAVSRALSEIGTRRNAHAREVTCDVTWESVMRESRLGPELEERAAMFGYPGPA